ncbi:MAG: hypothetical protein JW829_10305 [Pirellulales bacterium]|nr:hypothetical protein [Pirellulales bacterium]
MSRYEWDFRHESDAVIFAAAECFLDAIGIRSKRHNSSDTTHLKKRQLSPTEQVVDFLRKKGKKVTRQQIYPIFWEAFRRNLIVLRPPLEQAEAEKLIYKFGFELASSNKDALQPIRVLDVSDGNEIHRHIAYEGARIVHLLIKELAKDRERVHLGLGPGLSPRLLSGQLGRLLAEDSACPPLTIHAMSSGGLTLDDASISPITFFHYYDNVHPDITTVGLFTEAVVRCDQYNTVIQNPSVRKAFDQKNDIDIIITTLNAAFTADKKAHTCGILAKYLNAWDDQEQTRAALTESGWIGDIQFLPFARSGPIQQRIGIRTVSLFELDELVEFARRPGKHVVLLASPCRKCGMSRAEAAWPLLVNPSLRVWTHFVTDTRTAQSLLLMPRE